jgi:hypothetical protein
MHDLTCKCGRTHANVESLPFRCRCGEWFRDFLQSPIVVTAGNVDALPHIVLHLPPGKVGTELVAIIPRIFKSKECNCLSYAAQMDAWGLQGCIDRYDEIISHLVEQSNRRWFARLFPESTREAKVREWLNLAIQRAQEKLTAEKPIIDNGDWYVAITTAPRKDCTLLRSIESIRQAGWEPTVFAEPGSTASDCETVWHEQRKGVWHNWLASARYAIDNSNASIILTVQDDSLFHPDSRTYAESILWPASHAGFVSLYTPKHYSYENGKRLRAPGVNRINTVSLWGACALIWPRSVLAQVVEHPVAKTWLGARPRSGSQSVIKARKADPSKVANSDTAIGRILNKMGRSMWFIDPSPVSHIAVHSTISHGGNTGRRNCYRCSDHSIPLADQAPVRKAVPIE